MQSLYHTKSASLYDSCNSPHEIRCGHFLMPGLRKGGAPLQVEDLGIYEIEDSGKITFDGYSCTVWDKDKVVKVLSRTDNTCEVAKGYKCYAQDGWLSLN